eukprot:3480918-Rhodomonas_salina.1
MACTLNLPMTKSAGPQYTDFLHFRMLHHNTHSWFTAAGGHVAAPLHNHRRDCGAAYHHALLPPPHR